MKKCKENDFAEFKVDCMIEINKSAKLECYASFKLNFNLECYLLNINNFKLRKALDVG